MPRRKVLTRAGSYQSAFFIAILLSAACFLNAQQKGFRDDRIFDVRAYGAAGNGKTLDTQSIQQAVRSASQAGGGRVVFPPGTYLTGTFDAEAGMVVYGDEQSWIHNLTFEQIRFKIRPPRNKAADLVGGDFDFRWTAQQLSRAVFQHDVPGLYARYIDGFEIHGLQIDWGKALPDYFSDAIEGEDLRDFHIARFAGSEAKGKPGRAAIVLRRSQGVSVNDSRALPGTSTLLYLENVSGEGLFIGNDLRAAKRAFDPGPGGFKTFANLMPEM